MERADIRFLTAGNLARSVTGLQPWSCKPFIIVVRGAMSYLVCCKLAVCHRDVAALDRITLRLRTPSTFFIPSCVAVEKIGFGSSLRYWAFWR